MAGINQIPMTLGQFLAMFAGLPASTPLVIANFDASPHANPQYFGLSIGNVQYQNMVQIGSWWHNLRDPNSNAGEDLPQQLVLFLNPIFPQENQP